MTQPPSSNRRDFVRSVSVGLGAGLLATPTATPAAIEAPQVEAPPGQEDEEEPDPVELEVEARMSLLLARYGDQLDDEAREQIRRQVAGNVRRGRALKEFAVGNGDQSASIFRPYRAPLA